MTVRPLTIEDYDDVYALWTRTPGIGLRSQDDSREGVAKYLARNPGISFAAIDDDGTLVGALLAGHDGRRGYISHTVVDERVRRRGVGRAMVDAVTAALRREGINKVALVAFVTNETGNAFWEKLGFFVRSDLVYRNKSLNADNV